ncbi:MAG: hypothetical protein AB8H79_23420 [Myxococcota bacterium]
MEDILNAADNQDKRQQNRDREEADRARKEHRETSYNTLNDALDQEGQAALRALRQSLIDGSGGLTSDEAREGIERAFATRTDDERLALAHALAHLHGGDLDRAGSELGQEAMAALKSFKDLRDEAVTSLGATDDLSAHLAQDLGALPPATLQKLAGADDIQAAMKDRLVQEAVVGALGKATDPDSQAAIARLLLDGANGDLLPARRMSGQLSGTAENDAINALKAARDQKLQAIAQDLESGSKRVGIDEVDGRPVLLLGEGQTLSPADAQALKKLGVRVMEPGSLEAFEAKKERAGTDSEVESNPVPDAKGTDEPFDPNKTVELTAEQLEQMHTEDRAHAWSQSDPEGLVDILLPKGATDEQRAELLAQVTDMDEATRTVLAKVLGAPSEAAETLAKTRDNAKAPFAEASSDAMNGLIEQLPTADINALAQQDPDAASRVFEDPEHRAHVESAFADASGDHSQRQALLDDLVTAFGGNLAAAKAVLHDQPQAVKALNAHQAKEATAHRDRLRSQGLTAELEQGPHGPVLRVDRTQLSEAEQRTLDKLGIRVTEPKAFDGVKVDLIESDVAVLDGSAPKESNFLDSADESDLRKGRSDAALALHEAKQKVRFEEQQLQAAGDDPVLSELHRKALQEERSALDEQEARFHALNDELTRREQTEKDASTLVAADTGDETHRNIGTAAQIEGTDFHGTAGADAGLDNLGRADVASGLAGLHDRFDLRLKPDDSSDGIAVDLPVAGGKTLPVRVREADASELPGGAVACYERGPDGETLILVSKGAHPDHVERALSHELAEIRHLEHLRDQGVDVDDPTVFKALAASGALRAGAMDTDTANLPTGLTPHDVGRLPELDYVFGARGNASSEADQIHTLHHLGLLEDTPDATARLDAVRKAVEDPKSPMHGLVTQKALDALVQARDRALGLDVSDERTTTATSDVETAMDATAKIHNSTDTAKVEDVDPSEAFSIKLVTPHRLEAELKADMQLATLAEAAQLRTSDPETAQSHLDWVMDQVGSKPGHGAVMHAIAKEPTLEGKIAAARDLIEYSKLLDHDVTTLKPEQLEIVKKALFHLQKREINFIKVAREQGLEAAHQAEPGLAYRKIYDPDGNFGTLLKMSYGDSVAGAIGVSDNTEGLTSLQSIASMGLLYTDHKSGKKPFLDYDEDGSATGAKERVGVLDNAATLEAAEAAKVSVHPDIRAYLAERAMMGDTEALALLDRTQAIDNGAFGKDALEGRDFTNEYSGLGGTRTALGGLPHLQDFSTINLEQKIEPGNARLQPGDTASMLDEQGNKRPFATFDGSHWQLTNSEHLTPDERLRFRAWISEQPGFDKTNIDKHDVHVATVDSGVVTAESKAVATDDNALLKGIKTARDLGEGVTTLVSHGEDGPVTTMDIEGGSGTIRAEVKVAALPEGQTARRALQDDGTYTIEVSDTATSAQVAEAMAHHIAAIRVHSQQTDGPAPDGNLTPGPVRAGARLGPDDAGRVAQAVAMLHSDGAISDAHLDAMGLGPSSSLADRLARLQQIEGELVQAHGHRDSGEMSAAQFSDLKKAALTQPGESDPAHRTPATAGIADIERDALAIDVLNASFRSQHGADEAATVSAIEALMNSASSPEAARLAVGLHVGRVLGQGDGTDPEPGMKILRDRVKQFYDPELRQTALDLLDGRSDSAHGLHDMVRAKHGHSSETDQSIGMRRVREVMADPGDAAASLLKRGVEGWDKLRNGDAPITLSDPFLKRLATLPPSEFAAFQRAIQGDPDLASTLSDTSRALLHTDPATSANPVDQQEAFARRLAAHREDRSETAVRTFVADGVISAEHLRDLKPGSKNYAAAKERLQSQLNLLVQFTDSASPHSLPEPLLKTIRVDHLDAMADAVRFAPDLAPGSAAAMLARIDAVRARLTSDGSETALQSLANAERHMAALDVVEAFEASKGAKDPAAAERNIHERIDAYEQAHGQPLAEAITDARAATQTTGYDAAHLLDLATTKRTFRPDDKPGAMAKHAAERVQGTTTNQATIAGRDLQTTPDGTLPPTVLRGLGQCASKAEAKRYLRDLYDSYGLILPKGSADLPVILLQRTRDPVQRAALTLALAKSMGPEKAAALDFKTRAVKGFSQGETLESPGLLAITASMPADEVPAFLDRVATQAGLAKGDDLRAAILERADGADARLAVDTALAGAEPSPPRTTGDPEVDTAAQAEHRRALAAHRTKILNASLRHEGLVTGSNDALVNAKDIANARPRTGVGAVLGTYFDARGESAVQASGAVDSRAVLMRGLAPLRNYLDPSHPHAQRLADGDPVALREFTSLTQMFDAARRFENANASHESDDAKSAIKLGASVLAATIATPMAGLDPAMLKWAGGLGKLIISGAIKGSGAGISELAVQQLNPNAKQSKLDVVHAAFITGLANEIVGGMIGGAAGSGLHDLLGGTQADKGELADRLGKILNSTAKDGAKQASQDRADHLLKQLRGEDAGGFGDDGGGYKKSIGEGMASGLTKGVISAGLGELFEGANPAVSGSASIGGAGGAELAGSGAKGAASDALARSRQRAEAVLADPSLSDAERSFVQSYRDEINRMEQARNAIQDPPAFAPLDPEPKAFRVSDSGEVESAQLRSDREQLRAEAYAIAQAQESIDSRYGAPVNYDFADTTLPMGLSKRDLPPAVHRYTRQEVDAEGQPLIADRYLERRGPHLSRAADAAKAERSAETSMGQIERRLHQQLSKALENPKLSPEHREQIITARRRASAFMSGVLTGSKADKYRESSSLPSELKDALRDHYESFYAEKSKRRAARGRIDTAERDLHRLDQVGWDDVRNRNERAFAEERSELKTRQDNHDRELERIDGRQADLNAVALAARSVTSAPPAERADAEARLIAAARSAVLGNAFDASASAIWSGRTDQFTAPPGSEKAARLSKLIHEATGRDPRELGLHLFDDKDRALSDRLDRVQRTLAADSVSDLNISIDGRAPSPHKPWNKPSEVHASIPLSTIELPDGRKVTLHAADFDHNRNAATIMDGSRLHLFIDRNLSPGEFDAVVAAQLVAQGHKDDTVKDREKARVRADATEQRFLQEAAKRGDAEAKTRLLALQNQPDLGADRIGHASVLDKESTFHGSHEEEALNQSHVANAMKSRAVKGLVKLKNTQIDGKTGEMSTHIAASDGKDGDPTVKVRVRIGAVGETGQSTHDGVTQQNPARFIEHPDGTYEVILAPGLRPTDAIRAITHEFAEIRHRTFHSAHEGVEDTGLGGFESTARNQQGLTGETVGRLGELSVLVDKTVNLGDYRVDKSKAKKDDVAERERVLEHLGLNPDHPDYAHRLMVLKKAAKDGQIDPRIVVFLETRRQPKKDSAAHRMDDAEMLAAGFFDGDDHADNLVKLYKDHGTLTPDELESLQAKVAANKVTTTDMPEKVTTLMAKIKTSMDSQAFGEELMAVARAVNNPADLRALERELAKHGLTPKTLLEKLKKENRLQGDDLAEFEAHLSGDRVTGAKAKVLNVLDDNEFEKQSTALVADVSKGFFGQSLAKAREVAAKLFLNRPGLIKEFAKRRFWNSSKHQDQALAALLALSPSERQKMLADPAFASRIPNLRKSFKKSPAKTAMFDALTTGPKTVNGTTEDESTWQKRTMAKVAVAHMDHCTTHMHKANHLKGSRNLRQELQTLLKGLSGDPERYTAFLEAYAEKHNIDPSNHDAAAKKLAEEMGEAIHSGKKTKVSESDHHARGASLDLVELAEMHRKNAELEAQVGVLTQTPSGAKMSTAERIQTLELALEGDTGSATVLGSIVQEHLGDPEAVRAAIAYLKKKQAVEQSARANLLLSALEAGRVQEVLTHLADPTLQDLDDSLRAKKAKLETTSDPKKRTKLEAEIAGIDAQLALRSADQQAFLRLAESKLRTGSNPPVGPDDVGTPKLSSLIQARLAGFVVRHTDGGHDQVAIGKGKGTEFKVRNDAKFVQDLADKGYREPHEQVMYSLLGFMGRSIQRENIKTVLANKSPAELRTVAEQFKAQYGKHFEGIAKLDAHEDPQVWFAAVIAHVVQGRQGHELALAAKHGDTSELFDPSASTHGDTDEESAEKTKNAKVKAAKRMAVEQSWLDDSWKFEADKDESAAKHAKGVDGKPSEHSRTLGDAKNNLSRILKDEGDALRTGNPMAWRKLTEAKAAYEAAVKMAATQRKADEATKRAAVKSAVGVIVSPVAKILGAPALALAVGSKLVSIGSSVLLGTETTTREKRDSAIGDAAGFGLSWGIGEAINEFFDPTQTIGGDVSDAAALAMKISQADDVAKALLNKGITTATKLGVDQGTNRDDDSVAKAKAIVMQGATDLVSDLVKAAVSDLRDDDTATSKGDVDQRWALPGTDGVIVPETQVTDSLNGLAKDSAKDAAKKKDGSDPNAIAEAEAAERRKRQATAPKMTLEELSALSDADIYAKYEAGRISPHDVIELMHTRHHQG